MEFELNDIGGFLVAVVSLIGPWLLILIGGSVAFTIIRVGLKWGKRST